METLNMKRLKEMTGLVESLTKVPLSEASFQDVDGFDRDLTVYIHPAKNEIVVTFTGGFSTSKEDHIGLEVIHTTFDIVRKNHNLLPKNREYAADTSNFGRDFVRFYSDDLYSCLSNLVPDKDLVDQLINSGVATDEDRPSAGYVRAFWNLLTVNLAKKGFKIVKVS